MKILLHILFLVTCYLLLVTSVIAQTATSSSDISDDEIKESIRQRLERVSQDEDKDTSAGTIAGTASSVKRAWSGTLQDIAGTTLTIKTKSDTKLAKITADTIIVGDSRQTIAAENLEVDSFIIAMGYIDGNDILDTRRVAVSAAPDPSPFSSYLVEITSIQKDVLTVTDLSDRSQTWELSLASAAAITQTVAGDQTAIELTDLQVGDHLVIIAAIDPDEPTILEAQAVHLATARIIPAASSEATPSASDE